VKSHQRDDVVVVAEGVLFVVGVMNLVWVAAMTIFVLVEKIGPAGALVARVAGVAMIAAGALVWKGL